MSELYDLWQKARDSIEGDDAFARLRRTSLHAAASKFGIEPPAGCGAAGVSTTRDDHAQEQPR